MLLNASLSLIIGVVVVALVVLYLVDQHLLAPALPSPAIYAFEGDGREGFSIRTRLRLYLNCVDMYHKAWHKYIKLAPNHAVLLPGLGVHSDAILPHSSMKWALSQPDDTLSSYDAIVELNQVMYSLGHSRFIQDPWQGHLVRTKLFNAFESMTADLSDELTYALDANFGTDTENWKEIHLIDTINRVVAHMAGRLTVGSPLCRSKDYIDVCVDATEDFMTVAGAVRAMPHILRPIVGPIMGWWYNSHVERTKAIFKPLYEERIALLQHTPEELDDGEPNDYMQLMVRYAAKHRPTELASLDIMTRRLIIANFGTIHQPALLVANTLLNIIASDHDFNTIATLQNELASVFGFTPDGTAPDITDHRIWTRLNLNRLEKADSLMRETARLHTFGSRAMLRKVVAKEGVTTDTGIHIPHGRCVSFMAHPVQMDEDIFENPELFDPFRFSRMRAAVEEKLVTVNENAELQEDTNTLAGHGEDLELQAAVAAATKAGPLRFVTTSPTHLTFGHGRHACPGRFVVDFQLKMIIAHVITRYELSFPEEYRGVRPENTWMADVKLPKEARIRVRRKQF